MDAKIFSEGIKPDILRLLHQGKFNAVLESIAKRESGKFFNFFRKSKAKPSFAYSILGACLDKKLKPEEYSLTARLNFDVDFLDQLKELFRILSVLKDYSKASEFEEPIALTLLECIRDGADYIEQNASDYPRNSINGQVWMAGAGLRSIAQELMAYFDHKEDDLHSLDTVLLKAKITLAIMSHYPDLVGPDMLAIASRHEKMGDTEQAKQFLKPLILDFTSLVQGIKEGLSDPDPDLLYQDIPVTESLIMAMEGLQRLGELIDEEMLKEAREILAVLKKHKTQS
jgi:hypothetical protein